MLSVVLTTYNRPGHLRRLLEYFKGLGLRRRIYVGDASAPAALERNIGLVRSLAGRLDIRHIILDSSTDYFEVLYRCLKEVETEFVVHMADDDFIIPSCMEVCAEYLRRNPGYESVQGSQVLFNTASDLPISRITRVMPLKMVDYSVKGKSAVERIRTRMSQRTRLSAPKTVYSVMRTNTAVRLYTEVLSLGLDHSSTEGTMNQMVLLAGNIKLINRLYIARQYHGANAAQKAVYNYVPVITMGDLGETLDAVKDERKEEKERRKPDFFDLLVDPLTHVKYSRRLECLAKELLRRDGIPIEKARAVIKGWEWYYMAKNMMPKFREHGGLAFFCGEPARRNSLWRLWNMFGVFCKNCNAMASVFFTGAGFIAGLRPICHAVRDSSMRETATEAVKNAGWDSE